MTPCYLVPRSGFNFENMFGAFVSGIGLFSVVRLGGIPVPNTCAGRGLWFLVVLIQFIEYLLVFLSLISVVLGYFHTRYYYRECMIEVLGVLIMDICSLFTALVVPVVVQGLFVLFIYAYVFSTCLKVWNASKPSVVDTEETDSYQEASTSWPRWEFFQIDFQIV